MTWTGSSSYVRLHLPDDPMARSDGSVLEHRKVAAKMRGVEVLPRDLHVHHRNGNPRDNRPENLEILSNSEHWHRHWKDGSFSST